MIRRAAAACAVLLLAASVAVGCGGDDAGGGSGPGASGIVGNEGPLSWLPQDTWLVASANLDAKAIDDAVKTLDRLPIWSLAESFLPASDGKGLRRELLEEIAKETAKDGGKPRVTAKQLEAAFGDRAGMAITGTDFEKFEGDDVPVAVWVEVDDEDAAITLLRSGTEGADKEASHEGVDYLYSTAKGEKIAFLVEDGLAVVAPNRAQLERLIDAHEGDDSLADDATARAVIEAGIGDALGGIAMQSDPLLEAAPELARTAAKEADDPAERRRAEELGDKLGPLLESKSIDGLVADWMSSSITIDDSGLRIRGAWSNPRGLADPKPGTRELVELAPAASNVVSATATSGEELDRIQNAWKDVRDAYDLDLRTLADEECPAAQAWACDLGAELALAVLEDEELADASKEMGDTAMLSTQDFSALFSSAFTAAMAQDPAANTVPKIPTPTSRFIEYAVPTSVFEDPPEWKPGAELAASMTAAGLAVTHSAKDRSATIKVAPGSPLAAELRKAGPELAPALAIYGIDPAALFTTGLVIKGVDAGDLTVFGMPQSAPSPLGAALESGEEQLGDDEQYGKVIDAAKVPKRVGQYGYVDLAGLVEQVLVAVGKAEPTAQRVIPTVRNNLTDVPGIVMWTARDEVGGERVGTWDLAVPILK